MKLKLFTYGAVIASIILSCGAPPIMVKQEIKPQIKAIPDKAVLVIVRGSGYNGEKQVPNFLDGKFIGYTLGKSYFLTQVDPGTHYVVSQGENRACARFDYEAGKIYYLLQVVYPGVMNVLHFMGRGRVANVNAGRTGYEPKNPEEAQKDIDECDYLMWEPKNGTVEMSAEDFKTTTDDFEKEAKEDPAKQQKILEYKGY
jgi:hypothetical protein